MAMNAICRAVEIIHARSFAFSYDAFSPPRRYSRLRRYRFGSDFNRRGISRCRAATQALSPARFDVRFPCHRFRCQEMVGGETPQCSHHAACRLSSFALSVRIRTPDSFDSVLLHSIRETPRRFFSPPEYAAFQHHSPTTLLA